MSAPKAGRLLLEGDRLDSDFADSYRTLRASIVAGSNGQGPMRRVLVASARAGEGRTTTVANLGIIIGRSGSRVLVVDADLRHPSLHELLLGQGGLNRLPRSGSPAVPARGLADLIREDVGLHEVLLSTRFEGVSLLPAGSSLDEAGDLLASSRAAEVMGELAGAADQILIDSPPCVDYVDAVVLSNHVDALIYVVRAGAQDRKLQKQVRAQLQHTRAQMIGVVLNSR